MKFLLRLMPIFLLVGLYSTTFAQDISANYAIPRQSGNIPQNKSQPKKRVAHYFNSITHDVIKDGIHSITDIPGTFKNMFTIPFNKDNQISTWSSLGFFGCSFFFDKNANKFFRDKWDPYCSKYIPNKKFLIPVFAFGLKTANDYYDNVFLALAEYGYAFGLFTRNQRLRILCFNLMESTAYSFIFTRGIKTLSGRARPWREGSNNRENNPWDWGNLNSHIKGGGEYNSFPSFHATYYVTYCTIVMDYFGHRWAGPLVASLFYFQLHTAQWFSDMVAGGILGYWLGSGVIERSKEHKNKNTSITIYPMIDGLCFNVAKVF